MAELSSLALLGTSTTETPTAQTLVPLAQISPSLQVPVSLVTHLGSYLTIQWTKVIALFAVIAGGPSLLFTSAIHVTRSMGDEKTAIWPIRRCCSH